MDALTVYPTPLTDTERAELAEALNDVERPRRRADCINGPRPCPFVGCEHHLYLDVNPQSGTIKLNFPGLDVDQMAETCALDVADRGGASLEEVGALVNLTRERIRQLEFAGLAKLRAATERNDRLCRTSSSD